MLGSKQDSNYNTLYQRSIKRAQKKRIINQLAQLERASLDAANCTFQPRINPNTQEMLHRKSQRQQQTGKMYSRSMKKPLENQ